MFALALLFHGWGASLGWNNGNLPGCEFRQAQTALSAQFIQREHNFSLAYPTPVLGKPWSIPMEFPLYQWTVVGLSNATGLPLTPAGRTVSLVCFYLALPALFLLLARLGLPWGRRLVVLALVLCCPLYIFYARSFLIETMAWMFGCWFLAGYVFAVERRSAGWWLVAAGAGAGAGLVKVTTLMFFLLPALTWTLAWLCQDWSRGAGRWRALWVRVVWAGSAVILPGAAAVWWVGYSDAVKARSVAGAFLQSASMSGYNFGVGSRWSAELWAQHWHILFHELAPAPVLAFCGVVALVFARRWWGWIVALVSFFFAVQVACPILYAWHEYYYVANAMMLMAALGLALCGLLESRLPRWGAWVLVAGVLVAQGRTYLARHYAEQREASVGGNPVARALQAVTEPDDVVVIAGDDWSSITPYFAQRRALMIRRNLETTWDLIHPACRALQGEPVTALVLYGRQQQNQPLLEIMGQYFQIDPRPAGFFEDAAIYLHRQLRGDGSVLASLRRVGGIRLPPGIDGEAWASAPREAELQDLLPRWRARFSRMSPLPAGFKTAFVAERVEQAGETYLLAHAVTRLWFKAPLGQRAVTVQWLLLPDAYTEKISPGDRSDGVELAISVRQADGTVRPQFSRYLNPRDNPADRGPQENSTTLQVAAGEDIVVEILPGPNGNAARDWAALGQIRIN